MEKRCLKIYPVHWETFSIQGLVVFGLSLYFLIVQEQTKQFILDANHLQVELTYNTLTLNCRTSAGRNSSSRIHPENVPRTEPGQRQDAVPSLHLRHRHRKHPLRLCGRQRHHPQTQSEGVQSGVKSRRRRRRGDKEIQEDRGKDMRGAK